MSAVNTNVNGVSDVKWRTVCTPSVTCVCVLEFLGGGGNNIENLCVLFARSVSFRFDATSTLKFVQQNLSVLRPRWDTWFSGA